MISLNSITSFDSVMVRRWIGQFTLVNFCASDGCELWSESQAMCLIITRYSHHRFMLHCANVWAVLQLEKSW